VPTTVGLGDVVEDAEEVVDVDDVAEEDVTSGRR